MSLVSLSHTYTCHIISYHYFSHPKIFPWTSCVSVLYNGKSTMLVLYHHFYLYSAWISALFCCAAQLRPLAGHRLRPQAEVAVLASAAAISSQMLMCPCVSASICTLIRCQCHLTIQVKIRCPTDWVESRNLGSNAAWVLPPPCTVGRDADSVASSHSAPIRVLYCLYSESGLFWAI